MCGRGWLDVCGCLWGGLLGGWLDVGVVVYGCVGGWCECVGVGPWVGG